MAGEWKPRGRHAGAIADAQAARSNPQQMATIAMLEAETVGTLRKAIEIGAVAAFVDGPESGDARDWIWNNPDQRPLLIVHVALDGRVRDVCRIERGDRIDRLFAETRP